jgi:hypothetical protein
MSDGICFTCPSCGASHTRGYHHGIVGYFRCLHCGYDGHGHHPDRDVDEAVHAEIVENRAWNVQHGLPAGPVSP